MPEFNDLTFHAGQSAGRLARSTAVKGSYLYSLTDEEQGYIDIVFPGAFMEVFQNVNVTALNGITLRVKWKASPDTVCRLEVNLAGGAAYSEDIAAGTTEKDWYIITVPCAKLAGVVPLAVTVQFVS